jgi:AcrR family transcriptional regulator
MFYREGIRAVGIDAIAAEADVTKKTLYDKFGSKDKLIAAYLRARDERWRSWLVGVVERRGGTARERLLSTFDALAEWMERENPRGCGFVNAAAELPHADHPARVVVIEQKAWMRGYLAELAAEGGAENPEDLAERLVILHEGATVAFSWGWPKTLHKRPGRSPHFSSPTSSRKGADQVRAVPLTRFSAPTLSSRPAC